MGHGTVPVPSAVLYFPSKAATLQSAHFTSPPTKFPMTWPLGLMQQRKIQSAGAQLGISGTSPSLQGGETSAEGCGVKPEGAEREERSREMLLATLGPLLMVRSSQLLLSFSGPNSGDGRGVPLGRQAPKPAALPGWGCPRSRPSFQRGSRGAANTPVLAGTYAGKCCCHRFCSRSFLLASSHFSHRNAWALSRDGACVPHGEVLLRQR